MTGKLKNFLSELAVNAQKLASYQQNPDAAMKDAGLDADECAALKSGDPAKVYASLSGQEASGGQGQTIWAAGQGNCIWGAQPQANCIWNAPPQAANCIWGAQPQAHCIWNAPPQPPQANCIWGAQPQAHCIWSAPPQAANCIWGAQPQPPANCIWGTQPQPPANCIWAQPPANCIWGAQPQPPTIWATQPCTVFVHHHFIYGVPPQPNSPTAAQPEPNQPSSQKGGSTSGKTS